MISIYKTYDNKNKELLKLLNMFIILISILVYSLIFIFKKDSFTRQFLFVMLFAILLVSLIIFASYIASIISLIKNYRDEQIDSLGLHLSFKEILNCYHANENAYKYKIKDNYFRIKRVDKYHAIGYKSFLDYLKTYDYFREKDNQKEREEKNKIERENIDFFLKLCYNIIINKIFLFIIMQIS